MKTLLKRATPLLFLFTLFLSHCNKEEDTLSTFDMVCGEWTVTDIQYDLRINDLSLPEYLMGAYGMTEEEAQIAFTQNENAYKAAWTGTMLFKQDGKYEFNIGGENHSNYWFLSKDEQTIHVYFTGYYMDFDIMSIDEKIMKLSYDPSYRVDIDEDGTREIIKYLNEFILEK